MAKKLKTEPRTAGVLMPVASLPSKEGAGTFGREAYRFVDLLAGMDMGIWQLLPLNPLGYGNSPYQPFSSYAGDELYIDLDLLERDGLLPGVRAPYEPENPGRVEYERARAYKEPYLHAACERFYAREPDPDFEAFRKKEWVYPYAVFIALKKQNGLRCWNQWPKEQQDWILDRKYDISHLEGEIRYQIFVQYIFCRQWMALKAYANEKGIRIMGDVPFYVGIDSLDVWGSRDNFLLDDQWQPAFVAGVPPDYFSKTGQRWGNPIYNWENMEKDSFSFWIDRLGYSSTLYDIVRIDHFRAFDTYWKIPASCETAIEGEWVEAPGYAVFDELYRRMPDIRIVAEDLGELRPEVLTLRDHYGIMGMNIVEFTLLDPDKITEHQLIYTGTHDNQTVKGWYSGMSRGERVKVRRELARQGYWGEPIARRMVRLVYGSPAAVAIVPLTDLLGLDDVARLNTPGTLGTPNWEWRLTEWRWVEKRGEFVRELVRTSGRSSHG